MTWIETRGKSIVDLANVDHNAISLEDIAWALSMQCRFAGHCMRFYSVLEHSLLMGEMAAVDSDRLQLHCLLHDAAEAYTGDVIGPLKQCLHGTGLSVIDLQITQAIYRKLQIAMPTRAEARLVKELDLRMLATEQRDLYRSSVEWPILEGRRPFLWHIPEHELDRGHLRNMWLRIVRERLQ